MLDPPDRGVLPAVEDFIAALPADCRDLHAAPLREALETVLTLLRRQFSRRPGVNLRNELKRMRNQFFHYHAHRNCAADLGDAIAAAAHENGAYVIGREGPEEPADHAGRMPGHSEHAPVHPSEGGAETVRPVAEEKLQGRARQTTASAARGPFAPLAAPSLCESALRPC